MESLSNIIKNYRPNSSQDMKTQEVKKALSRAKIPYTSIKVQNSTLVLYVSNHIEATEIKYKQNYILKVLKNQDIKKLLVHAKD